MTTAEGLSMEKALILENYKTYIIREIKEIMEDNQLSSELLSVKCLQSTSSGYQYLQYMNAIRINMAKDLFEFINSQRGVDHIAPEQIRDWIINYPTQKHNEEPITETDLINLAITTCLKETTQKTKKIID